MATDPILREIETFCRTHNMTESTFGRKALGDWRFVKELRGTKQRGPRRVWPETAQKVRDFISSYHPDVDRKSPEEAKAA